MPRYLTRVVSRIEADSPLDAVAEYQRELYEIPLADRVYRVENEETGEMVYVHDREVFTIAELKERYVDSASEEAARIKAAEEGAKSEDEMATET